MSTSKRIFLVHATRVAMDPVNAAFAQLWPQARCFNLWDDSLSLDASEAGQVTPALEQRIQDLAEYAFRAEADAVLFTCSSFSDAIEACQKRYPKPVLKPNEAMVREALEAGGRIAAVTTFVPAGAAIVRDFADEASRRGQAIEVETILCEGALNALKAGNQALHDQLIAQTVTGLQDRYDVVCFAQFSMTTAAASSQKGFNGQVLTTPGSAVNLLRNLMNS